nr:hypothetical protein [Rhizobium sp. ACO-34A]
MTLVVYSMILSCALDPRPILPLFVPGVVLGVCASAVYLVLQSDAGASGSTALLTAAFLLGGSFLRA